MTPLIDRYLQNVRVSLPAARRDDIVRELAEDIRAQVADREEELGRALTEDEQEALLNSSATRWCWRPATARSAT